MWTKQDSSGCDGDSDRQTEFEPLTPKHSQGAPRKDCQGQRSRTVYPETKQTNALVKKNSAGSRVEEKHRPVKSAATPTEDDTQHGTKVNPQKADARQVKPATKLTEGDP